MKESSSTRTRTRFTLPERQAIIMEYRSGSMSQATIAQKYGISKSTMQNWLRHFREKQAGDRTNKLVPVRLVGTPNSRQPCRASHTGYRITLKSNRQLRFTSGFDPEEVSMLIKILEETC
jgi:transposase-like protein